MAGTDLENRQSWIEGAYEQMDKRIKMMEDLYQSIERKLWVLIILGIGSIISILLKS